MNELIIKTEDELKKHFEDHQNYHDSIMDKMMNVKFDDRIDNPEYQRLSKEYDETRVDFGEWGLFYDKIEMYYSHEGAVLSYVKFCPFCGIRLTVQNKGNVD